MKHKLLILTIILMIVLITLVGTYFYRMERSINIDFESYNCDSNGYTRAQGNYVLASEKNPFLFGGRILLKSVPENKIYYIDDYKALSEGLWNGTLANITEAAINGDIVCWFESWDGSNQGAFHMINIKNKSKKYKVPEYVYSEYAFNDSFLYYVDYEDIDPNGRLMVCNTESGVSTVLATDCYPKAITLIDDKLYYYNYDKKTLNYMSTKTNGDEGSIALNIEGNLEDDGVLGVVRYDEGRILIQTIKDGIFLVNIDNDSIEKRITERINLKNCIEAKANTIHVKDDWIYYYDENWNIHKTKIDGQSDEVIINWKKLEETSSYIENNLLKGKVIIDWCTDYIVVGIECNFKKYFIFDYDGNLVK